MNFLLDTGAVIVLRDSRHADELLLDLASVPALSVVSVVELEGGVVQDAGRASERRKALDRMLLQLPQLDFDRNCVRAYQTIVEAAGFTRSKIVDRMIAATALAHSLTLVTTNERDFRDIPGLKLRIWSSVAPPE